ncbi:DNA polymerase III subunit delta' [Pontibacterium granulatum]|uniref:DNA polymerase III subunit delta' n=1 Tax=Pontibacterium granulatum TaxID=2036029 RepID=UPI00249A1876|nr:DNA polymerase III subunit delta' [Pontibacterium granulatum]MDI3326233.1 DNA polymerase III subunit delta' [Pontibacterium granulatum]
MAKAEVFPWLAECRVHLCELHRTQRLPHALIVHGAQGIGKANFATAFAHYLLCQSPQGDQPCGSCKACELNNVDGHPDLYLLEPDDIGKPIKVDQIRQLTDFICSTAQQGGYRVVIINPADAMNVAAANALLKMLEEPGKDTVLMLITDRLGQVMPTIKSRCQRVECPLPSEQVATDFVAQALSLDADEAQRLLRINNGAPMATLNYSESDQAEWRSQLVKGLADVLKQRRTVVEVAQAWQKADLELMLGWLYSMLVDISRAKATENEALKQEDAHNMLVAVSRKTNPAKVFELASLVQEERKSLILRQNTNKQMLLERILLAWSAIVR